VSRFPDSGYEASAASWDKILNVNLMSDVFRAEAALTRHNQGGAIVNSPPHVPSSRSAADAQIACLYQAAKRLTHAAHVSWPAKAGHPRLCSLQVTKT
jgi:hypothetical protein